MIVAMEVVTFVLGILCLALVFWDVFETVVLPRPTPGGFRLAVHLIRPTWRFWRSFAHRYRSGLARDRLLGLYAPGVVVLLLVAWLVVLIVGYGLVLFAIRDQLRPVMGDIGSTIYYAGDQVLTIGSADVIAVGPLARFVTLTAAGAGLGIVALVITFLFSLYGSFQRRERLVVTLQARAGAPPSAVVLLGAYAKLGMIGDLSRLFADWEQWSAEVLDTHVAYPILGYFRSSHDNLSWISSLGAVLDSASLVLTTIRGIPRGQAELTKRVGAHLVEDISNYFHLEGDGSVVEREEFEEAYGRLAASGYDLEPMDEAWRGFERARGTYAARLEALAEHWATPATLWISERSPFKTPLHDTAQARAEDPSAGVS